MLRRYRDGRGPGPAFRRRGFDKRRELQLAARAESGVEHELAARITRRQRDARVPLERAETRIVARTVGRDLGAVRQERTRRAFLRWTAVIGEAEATAPQRLRHPFATALQDANVDRGSATRS